MASTPPDAVVVVTPQGQFAASVSQTAADLQQLCLRDRVLSPWDTRFQDRVCDGDQPAGDGDDDEFVLLAAHFEVLGDWLQNRIVTGGGKCGLEQGMPK